jgi:hypothetical protein
MGMSGRVGPTNPCQWMGAERAIVFFGMSGRILMKKT